jgi:hypothetical protein
MGISNNFNDETGTAGYEWMKSFLAEELYAMLNIRL